METISTKIFFIISQLLVGSIAQRDELSPCCPKIFYEGSAFHGGVYNELINVFHNQFPVYEQDQGDKFMVYCTSHRRWVIADADYTTWPSNYCRSYEYVQDDGTYCPQDTRGPWRQSDGAAIPGDGVRCSDCDSWPTEIECATCCNKVNLASTNREWRATRFYMRRFQGGWTATGSTINGKPEYRSDNNNRFCLWFNTNNQWMINRCGPGSRGRRGYIFGDGPAGMKCPEQATGWRFLSQNGNGMIQDRTMRTTCNDVDPCSEPFAVVGHCRAAISSWSYNQRTGKCEHFLYGGCGGNNNNFRNRQQCQKTCETTDTANSCTSSSDCHGSGKLCDPLGIQDIGCLCKRGECKISSMCGVQGPFFFTPCRNCNSNLDGCEDSSTCRIAFSQEERRSICVPK